MRQQRLSDNEVAYYVYKHEVTRRKLPYKMPYTMWLTRNNALPRYNHGNGLWEYGWTSDPNRSWEFDTYEEAVEWCKENLQLDEFRGVISICSRDKRTKTFMHDRMYYGHGQYVNQ